MNFLAPETSHIMALKIKDYIISSLLLAHHYFRARLTTWQMRHMPRASRLWGPRALLYHAHFYENTSIFYWDTPILGASRIKMPREFRDLAHLGPLGFHIEGGRGGGWGPRAENLPRASRDVNPALHYLR